MNRRQARAEFELLKDSISLLTNALSGPEAAPTLGRLPGSMRIEAENALRQWQAAGCPEYPAHEHSTIMTGVCPSCNNELGQPIADGCTHPELHFVPTFDEVTIARMFEQWQAAGCPDYSDDELDALSEYTCPSCGSQLDTAGSAGCRHPEVHIVPLSDAGTE